MASIRSVSSFSEGKISILSKTGFSAESKSPIIMSDFTPTACASL